MTDTPTEAPTDATPGTADAARRFLFLLGSARRGGNTETLARRAAEALPAAVAQRWLHLDDVPLPDFADIRHTGDGATPEPSGNERLLWEATLHATDIVIASPVYWYSVSATTKRYLDYWSGWLRVPGAELKPRMRGKTLWAVTVLGEEPSQAEPLVGMLRRTADYMSMRWGGVLIGNGSRPDNVLRDRAALSCAETFLAPERAQPAADPAASARR
jgi:multimeric flavodoxin WrbA